MKSILKVFMLVFMLGAFTGFSCTTDQDRNSDVVSVNDIDIGNDIGVINFEVTKVQSDLVVNQDVGQSVTLIEMITARFKQTNINVLVLDKIPISRAIDSTYTTNIDQHVAKQSNRTLTHKRSRDSLSDSFNITIVKNSAFIDRRARDSLSC